MPEAPTDNRQRGVAHPFAKLTEDDVFEIREAYAAGGVTQKELALQYGVHQAQICRVVRYQTYVEE